MSDYRVNLPDLSMVTVPHQMVGIERTLDYSSDYRGVGLEGFTVCSLQ